MGPLTTLSITRLNADYYSFVLERPPDVEKPFAAPFVPCAEVRVPEEVVHAMRERIAEAVVGRGMTPRAGEDPFLVPGRTLFDAFLPRAAAEARDLRDALRALVTPLLISTNEPETPWELLHDGEGFLGIKLAIGRSLRERGDAEAATRGARDSGNRRCLIISDPTGDLPSAAAEAAVLRCLFENRGFPCEQLAGADATFEAVLDRLAGGRFSIFHYAGHVTQAQNDSAGEFAFLLHGCRPLRASVVERCAGVPDAVFLNGCQSAQMVEGLTRAFLRAGSRMVLGSLFDAPSRGAAVFSQSFYDAFLGGRAAGEAVRDARSAVRAADSCGTAWACFVLYGDPRFAVGVDPLHAVLLGLGLVRGDFAPAARSTLERAFRLAGRAGLVTGVHLFAALVQGTDTYLRGQLGDRGIRPEKLAAVFEQALHGGTHPSLDPDVSISGGAREALRWAVEVARASGNSPATELDLLRGLVHAKGSSVWAVLRRLDVYPQDLDPDGDEFAIEHVGPLARAGCTDAGWRVLCSAAAAAERSGQGVVGSPNLFSAMMTVPNGALPEAFRRLNIPFEAGRECGEDTLPQASNARIECSPNAGEVLTLAQAIAAASSRPVDEPDLLAAFVETGGGATGAFLQGRGVVLRCLTSRLFLDGGLIDSARFSSAAMDVLDLSLEFARQKEYGAVGRRHLLFGLLSAPGGVLAARLKEQGKDNEFLADLLHATLNPGGSTGARLEMKASCFTPDLLKILCAAESASQRDRLDEVGESHLLEAWVEDGGGMGGTFLVQNSIRLRRLAENTGGI